MLVVDCWKLYQLTFGHIRYLKAMAKPHDCSTDILSCLSKKYSFITSEARVENTILLVNELEEKLKQNILLV